MDKERLAQAYQTVNYVRENRSTVGASDPVVYELLAIMLEAGFQMGQERPEEDNKGNRGAASTDLSSSRTRTVESIAPDDIKSP